MPPLPFCGSAHLVDPAPIRFTAVCPHGVVVTWVHTHGQSVPEPQCDHTTAA